MKTGIYWQNPAYPGKGMDFVLDPSLALYLPLHRLDEASFMSKDAYGHLCTVTGALWRPNGRWFDGSDDLINCGTSPSLDITGGITLEVWVYASTTGAFQTIIDKGLEYYCLRLTSGNFLEFKWLDESSDYHTTAPPFTSYFNLWTHIVATYDGSNAVVYLNLTPLTESEGNHTINTTSFGLFLGARYNNANPFNGTIGEVRVYRRALTPLEIQRNYLATKWRYR